MSPIEYALKEYGQKEIAGDKHNPRVVQYSTDIGNTYVKTDEVAWCSEFVNWCLLQAGIQGTKSAVARSFMTWGEETKTPQFGDLVIFAWDATSGHIGFYVNETEHIVRVLGGNQDDEVNITRYKKDRIVSYRKVPVVNEEEKAKAIYQSVVELLTRVLATLKAK